MHGKPRILYSRPNWSSLRSSPMLCVVHQHRNTKTLLVGFAIPAMAKSVFDDDVNDVPIDGGLSLLVAAGVGYGAKKLREKRNKTSN